MEKKYNKIYSVGCFDQFHYGHEILLQKMKEMGNILIIGVHDNSSIELLKNLQPSDYDDHEIRMTNVKKYANNVFIIPSPDPTFYLESIIGPDDNKENSCFVRGDDNINFPGIDFIKNKISIEYIPYTLGISATQIRANNKD